MFGCAYFSHEAVLFVHDGVLHNPTDLFNLCNPVLLCAALLPCRSQHIFVNPASPADDYSLTYNCLACADNSKTYNDGYHIMHHANSRTHWSELPSAFLQQLQAHDDKDGEYMQGLAALH